MMTAFETGAEDPMLDRRRFLGMTVAGAAAAALTMRGDRAWAENTSLTFGPARPFDFEILRRRARALAARPYAAPPATAAKLLQSLDFDAVQKIQYRRERALWAGGPGPYPVRFFHMHRYVTVPARIHAVSDGTAREVLYAAGNFDYGGTGIDTKVPKDLGYAGFRVMSGRGAETDWLAFQGASYFRSSGPDNQYGASARGIAIDSGLATPEEFPRFTDFWLADAAPGGRVITIFAALDGPSLTGAYRFDVSREGGVVMDVRAELFFRAGVKRLGIAPLTSMYWFGENDRRQATDWRPEVHDSDGLALWTGTGERIWRPLINPKATQTNSFLDDNPKGFGLIQRDRNFENYQDDGAFYERRPSLWVEPKGRWGRGEVQLVEIPTDDEIHDNIVAYWRPHMKTAAGASQRFDYRLHWAAQDPGYPKSIARVVSTRIGRGGVPGQPRPKNQWKFAIDFEGGPISNMPARYDLKPTVTTSRGQVKGGYVLKVVGTKRWRAIFDVRAEGKAPIDMRCFVRVGDKTLTETWLYQYFLVG